MRSIIPALFLIVGQNVVLPEPQYFMPPVNPFITLTGGTSQSACNEQKTLEKLCLKFQGGEAIKAAIDIRLNKLETDLQKTVKKLVDLQQDQKQENSSNFLDCKDAHQKGNAATGIYPIHPKCAPHEFLAVCNMKTKDGGWTYLLNREDDSQRFFLNWDDYKNGFGNLMGNFWLGLEHLYQLTGHRIHELLIELEDWDNKTAYAHYDAFSIACETEGYAIRLLGRYSGTAGDSLKLHVGSKFTTKDRGQDNHNDSNCAVEYSGAWWYDDCMSSQLTGTYRQQDDLDSAMGDSVFWETFRGRNYSLKSVRMLVRATNINIVEFE